MKRICMLVAAVLAINLGTALAIPLNITNVIGSWSNAQPGGTILLTINNVATQGMDTVRWGESDFQSGYNFTPGANIIGVPLGTPILLGTFQHVNQPIGGTSLSSIDYTFTFSTNGIPNNLTTTFHFVHDETDNSEPCAAGPEGPSVSVCDDFVTIGAGSLNQLISAGSDDYIFNLLGFSKDGGVTTRTSFQSPENGTTTAGLYGVVTTQQVPEPNTLLLLVTGLGGVAATIRRARKM
jgi:hypothetical protein